jgi:putative membrane protein
MTTITTSLRTTALVLLIALPFMQCAGEQKAAEAPSTMPSAEPPSDQTLDTDAGTAQTPAGLDIATSTAETSAPPAAAKPDALSDAQIAGVTEAANAAEIAEAKIAQLKSKDADVKSFAAMMIVHHGEAKQKQAKLKLKTEESGISTALNADAGATLDALKTESGKGFDETYIRAQIAAHQKVLDTINDKLLPNVKDASLKAYLEEIKPKVEEHLKQAKRLRASLDSKSSSVAPRSKSAG